MLLKKFILKFLILLNKYCLKVITLFSKELFYFSEA